MFFWRVTKYDPKVRDSTGIYYGDEWSVYDEIGKGITLNGETLIYQEYLKAENAYVSSIILIMESNNLELLKVMDLSKSLRAKLNDKNLSKKLKDAFTLVTNNSYIDKNQVDSIVRLILREKLWCKLISDDMFVHFGWDYYMYIGSLNKEKKAIEKIHKLGLFVENFESPYLEDEE